MYVLLTFIEYKLWVPLHIISCKFDPWQSLNIMFIRSGDRDIGYWAIHFQMNDIFIIIGSQVLS